MVQANRVLFVSIRFFRFDQIRVNARIVGRNGVESGVEKGRNGGKRSGKKYGKRESESGREGEGEREREGERDLPFRLHVASIDLLLRGAAFAKEPQSLVE